MATVQSAYPELDQFRTCEKFREDTEVISEIGAAADYSIGRPHLDPSRFFIVGHCMGGRLARRRR